MRAPRATSSRAGGRARRYPRIGPVRDPLALWFLEWQDPKGQVWRRYFANREEARAGLRKHREQL